MKQVRYLLLTASLLGLWALGTAGSAQALQPWFHLTSGSRPAYLCNDCGTPEVPEKPGTPGVDEVQQVSVKATGGRFVLANMTKEEIEEGKYTCFLGPNEEEEVPKYAEFEYDASAAEVQVGLEHVCGYGAGNVEVSGGPGDATGSKPYEVTFKGALAEKSVRLINTEIEGEPTPLEGTVQASQHRAPEKGIPGSPAIPPTDGELYMTAENVGDEEALGKGDPPVKLIDVIPKGLEAVAVAATKPEVQADFEKRAPIPCALEERGGRQVALCTLEEALAPYDQIEMRVNVKLKAGAHSGELNQLSVSGGGAPEASIKRPITLSSAPVPFGVESYEMGLEEEGGTTTVQAGAHPFQLTTTIALNQLNDLNPLNRSSTEGRPEVTPPALAKDLNFKLPAGLIGNATAISQCTIKQFYEVNAEDTENACPAGSAVGVASATVHEPATVGTSTLVEPVFNLEPREGEPARFGFYVLLANSPVFIDTSVRSGSDYGVTVNVQNITQTGGFLSSEVTFWGVPGDPRHDLQRGWSCLLEARGVDEVPCVAANNRNAKPFLSLPTSCTRTLSTSVEGDSWQDPGAFFDFIGDFEPQSPLSGCSRLPFSPQLKLSGETQEGSRPSGMKIDVHVPQESNESPSGLTSSNIRSLSLTFPPGFSVNPSSADSLQACSEGQIGYLNAQGAEEELLFSATLPEPFCPDAAKVGTAKIKTPLLSEPLEGGLYLATPAPNAEGGNNPFNSLIALYMVIRNPISGVLVKLPGRVSLDPNTGQISTTFQNTPDLSFEDAEVSLFGGARAPLATPAHCGSYPLSATFTPWSATAPVTSTASLQITSGPGGSPCPGASLPFGASLAAGTSQNTAGAFSSLSTSISREDGNQQLSAVSVHTPEGLSGVLSGVTLCSNAQADAGACPANSLIGHSTVSAGFGSNPFTVTGGQVFLTESYEGAPFGLSILTPAIAGPFNLGNVVVRARIEVDPHTAELTVSTDQSGPYAIPHILDGVPLDIRHVNVTIDRQGFTFNPTSCNPSAITATITGTEGASTPLSSPFQAASCQSLKFSANAPKFAFSASSKSTKANGTSFAAKITYPSAPLGTYANLASVKVSLPKQLPSRLTTLNKACTAAVFEANPEACPKESRVGTVKVSTPLLPVPLIGTAFFVSHAAEAFPDLTMVLKGYGITIDLIGNTQIKKGITTTTFKATPDVPFSTFELSLPAQPYSALTTNTNLCTAGKLVMPTEYAAQNGTVLKQNTPLSVSGCAKLTRAQQLAKALKSCRTKHSKAKRKSCEAQARKRYGAKKKAKAKKKK
jgi:hypothetical protein